MVGEGLLGMLQRRLARVGGFIKHISHKTALAITSPSLFHELYYLRIVVIEGYGVNSSQVAWFPLASTWFPVRHSKPQPQLGDKSDWNYNTWSYMQLLYFSWFIIKRTWSEEGLGDVEVGWFITRLDDGLSSGLNHRPSFKWNNRWLFTRMIYTIIYPYHLLFI